MDDYDAFSEVERVVNQVFRRVYEEFRVWKDEYASQVLASLTRDSPPSPPPETLLDAETSIPRSESPSVAPPLSTPSSLMWIDSYDYKTGISYRQPVEVTRIQDLPPQFPEHEYYTPSNRNIFHGDDPAALPFMPFPDDATFDHAAFAEPYKTYSWSPDAPNPSNIDPDLELVVIETARCLQNNHHMLYKHIDETGVLPYELLDRDGARGVVFRSRRRDYPPWPADIPDSAKRLEDDPPLIGTTPAQKLANLVANFCTGLNCIVGYCSTHLEPMPMPLPLSPIIRSDHVAEQANAPCGDRCFLVVQASEHVHWSDEDSQLLKMFLALDPNTLPCDLAKICRRPCFEAFYERRRLLPDAAIAPATKPNGKGPAKTRPKTPRAGSSIKFADLDSAQFTPGVPCRHEGPCDATTKCICYTKKAHCERWCRCDKKCQRRWRGCKCRALNKRCRTDSCSCYLAHRECDPELCRTCVAKDADANVCKNANIQRGKWKHTVVAPARWGRGLFMAENTEVDELIIEYVGELIFDPTTESREPVAIHRGRNYLFQLNESMSVDGTYVGNDARFINHDAETPNCRARVSLVNGEHRIGIYSTRRLTAGEEVLFNYGKHFFSNPGQDPVAEDEEDANGGGADALDMPMGASPPPSTTLPLPQPETSRTLSIKPTVHSQPIVQKQIAPPPSTLKTSGVPRIARPQYKLIAPQTTPKRFGTAAKAKVERSPKRER